MAETTVYVKFAVGDTSEITSKANELTQQEQKALAAGNAELAKKKDTISKTVDLQQKSLSLEKEHAAAIKDQQVASKSKAQEVSKNVINLGKELKIQKDISAAFQKQFVSAKTVGDQIIALGNVFDAAFKTGGAESVNAVFNELQDQIKGTGLTVDQFIEKIQNVDPATKLVTDDTRRMSKQFRDAREEMRQLAAAGKQNTQEYQDLAKKAVDLKNAMRSVNATLEETQKGNAVLSATTDTVNALSAGFQIATGAMALFGKQNEDVMKTIQFLNGVMVLSNGLQQASTILKNKDNIVTKALTFSYNTLTTAVYGTTTGLTAFDTALAATGVGVFIIAIGIAIEKLYTFVSSMYDASDAVAHMDLVMQKLNGTYEDRAKQIEKDGKIALEQAKRTDNAAENSYKVQKDINDKLVKNQQVKAAAFRLAADQIMDKNSEIGKSFKKDDEARRKEHDKYLKEAANAEQRALDLKDGNRLLDEKRQTELYQKSIQDAKKYAAERRALLKADQQARFDIEDRTTDYIIENQKKIASSDKEVIKTRLNALENANKLRLQQIEIQREREKKELVDSGKATTEQLLNIDDKYNTERDRQTNEYFEKRKDLILKNESEIAQAQVISQQNVIKARIDLADKGSREELLATNELVAAQAQAQKVRINQTVENEELKAAKIEAINLEMHKRIEENNEAFAKKRLADASEAEKQANDLAIAIASIQIIGKSSDSAAAFKTQQDARQKYLKENLDDMARLQYAYDTGQITDKEEFNKKMTELDIKASKQRIEILKAEAERRKKIQESIRDAAFNVAQSLSDAVFSANAEKRDAQLQEQQDQLEKARQNELDNENLTEQQKEQINERYDAKERQIKRRAAEQDKQASVLQAEINAALAVTKTLASVPFPFNVIAAAAIAAQALIQVTKIKSTPLPAYEKGTRSAKRGPGKVGEKGEEIVTFEGGETVLTHKETMEAIKYAGVRDMVTATVEKTINRNYVNEATAPVNVSNSIDYDKLAVKVGKQFKKYGLKVETNLDTDGFGQYIHEQGNKTQYLNQRYKL